MHLDDAARQFGDPRIARWHWPGDLGGPRTRAEVREGLQRQARQLDAEGFCLWWWRERETGEIVGQVGLNRTAVLGEGVVEVGWSISPQHWNKGFATEAAHASLAWGFVEIGLEEVVAFTLIDNAPSRRVIERLGMPYDSDFERSGLPHLLFRLGRLEWRQSQRAGP